MSTASNYTPSRRLQATAAPAAPAPRTCSQTPDELARAAQQMNAKNMEEAEHTHAFYEVRYEAGRLNDGSPEHVRIQEAGSRLNEIYTVNRRAATCTCPDFEHRVSKLRDALARVGLYRNAKYLCCKHGFIVEHKHCEGLLHVAAPVPDFAPTAASDSTKDFG